MIRTTEPKPPPRVPSRYRQLFPPPPEQVKLLGQATRGEPMWPRLEDITGRTVESFRELLPMCRLDLGVQQLGHRILDRLQREVFAFVIERRRGRPISKSARRRQARREIKFLAWRFAEDTRYQPRALTIEDLHLMVLAGQSDDTIIERLPLGYDSDIIRRLLAQVRVVHNKKSPR